MNQSDRPAVELKTQAELAAMRRAGRLAQEALLEAGKRVVAGALTKDLDRIAEEVIRDGGGVPTFIGYRGYPAAICVSINEEVVHGIPGNRRVQAGDIVSIDVAATLDGFIGDNARTFVVDPIDARTRRLVETTEASLAAGIEEMRVGNRLGDVSAAIQTTLESAGLGVIREYVGHGIGRRMHEEPPVPNYGERGSGIRFDAGLVLAIEPMAALGGWEIRVMPDGWTVVTRDGTSSAHFEHTVAVTKDGPVILTHL